MNDVKYNKQFNYYLFFLCILLSIKCFAQESKPIEKMPEYKGGEEQLKIDLNRFLMYPVKAMRRNIQGQVKIEFYVDTDATIKDIKVLEGITNDMDSTAIALIKYLDNWIPGTVNGKPVKVKMTLPINFKLNNDWNANNNQNKIQQDISLIRLRIADCLGSDSLSLLKKYILNISDTIDSKHYDVVDFHNMMLLYIIINEYDKASELIKQKQESNYINKISVYTGDWYKAVDLYLDKNLKAVSRNLYQSNIEKNKKEILKVFWMNDSIWRFPNPKNIIYNHYWGKLDKTAFQKRTQLGYEYLKARTDTTYDSYVRNNLILESRYKYFSWGFSFGDAQIIHNKVNRKIFTNPNCFTFDWEFFYKRLYFIFSGNFGGSRNYVPVTIDTAKFKPHTKLSNFYSQLGIGYLYYLSDVIHFLPYISYNTFDVSYSFKISDKNSISVNKYLNKNFAAGFALKYYFGKDIYSNYKPANYNPIGLTFKYSFIIPQENFVANNFAHYFGLALTLNIHMPKNETQFTQNNWRYKR